MTPRADSLGNTVSGADAAGLDSYERALHSLQCYIGDPLALADAAIKASPGMVMAHALRAWLHLLGTEPAGLPVARAAHRAAAGLPANERERGHLRAIDCLVEGRWHEAARVLEELSTAYPRDALALQAGHSLDFFTGNSRMLRDRIARALPHWNAGLPGFHALLGMHAFGLEEMAQYAQAEAQGRRALDLEPRDTWAKHAVAHVMEMQGRRRDGIAWMRTDPDDWSRDSFFAVHNWWHLALYHLGLGEIDAVLALYDGPINNAGSAVALEMIDASAMLWRLNLRGVSVQDRWLPLAERWAPLAAAGNYTFNDVHAMMAFVGAGRTHEAEAVLEAQRVAMSREGDNASFTREVGHPVALALQAFGRGKYGETVRLLRTVLPVAHRFGGSHAQRNLLDLTLAEAGRRASNQPFSLPRVEPVMAV